MMHPHLALAVIVLCLAIFEVKGIQRPRGVSLEKASFYEGNEFRCLSNGQSFPIDHVNDDYCDCEDGSDEPGTSACSNGLFYCENKPYKGSYLMSSRVNDGICDCCDGSDEYDGTIICENTCEKLFAEIRAQQEAFRKKQEEGYKKKLEYIQQGHRIKEEKRARLSELVKNKAALVEEKDKLQAVKEEVEAPEKEAKDAHEEAWKALKEQRQKELDAIAAAKAFEELDVNQDNVVDFPEIAQHSEFDIDSDGTVSEEEAKEYLEEKEQTDLLTFTEKIWPNIKEIFKSAAASTETEEGTEAQTDEGQPPPEEESTKLPENRFDPEVVEEGDTDSKSTDDLDRYGDEEADEDEDDDDEDNYPEDDDESYDVDREKRNAHRGHKEKEDESEKMPEYSEETKKLIEAADEARRVYDEADRRVRDIEGEISGIEKYLALDLGPQEEFSALKGECFEYTDREYTYKFCPFEKTSQKPKGGGMETSLGTWGHWHGPEEDKYDAMKFENGQGCWNGPSRSCHVTFHCGAENVLTSASEPSRCEYQFDFTTPARCSEPEAPSIHLVHEEL